jgi:hypothetical protein
MARKRFKPAEREAFTVGTAVEWCNGAHWKPGTVVGPIGTDSTGLAYVPVRNDAADTRTISKGEVVWGYPGHVRMPTTQ